MTETQKDSITIQLSEYNAVVDSLKDTPKVPRVYVDFKSDIGLIGFYVKEINEESDFFPDTKYIFIARSWGEALSFIRGLKLVISYLSIKF